MTKVRTATLRIVGAALILVIVAACTTTAPAPTLGVTPSFSALPTAADLEAGRALYNQGVRNAQACSSCHMQGAASGLGPSLRGISSTSQTRVSGQSAEEYLYNSIINPNAYLAGGYQKGLMPLNYGQVLTAQQIRDLIAYMLTMQ